MRLDGGVDQGFEAGHHVGRDQRHTFRQLRPAVGVRGQVGPDHEELALEAQDQGGGLGVGSERPGHAERGHGLVDAAVGLGGGVGLGDPAAVQQAGGAVVARLRVDPHPARISGQQGHGCRASCCTCGSCAT